MEHNLDPCIYYIIIYIMQEYQAYVCTDPLISYFGKGCIYLLTFNLLFVCCANIDVMHKHILCLHAFHDD